MRDIHPAFAQALWARDRQVTEAMVVTLPYGGATLRLVCLNRDSPLALDVDGAGDAYYYPLPWRREVINYQGDLQVDSVVISFPNSELLVQWTTDAQKVRLGDLALNGMFDHALVELYLVNQRNLGIFNHSTWEMTAVPSIDRSAVSFQLQSLMGRLARKGPRTIIQEGCNNSLGDASCQVALAALTVTDTANGNGTRVSMATNLGAGVYAAAYFDLGRVTFITGLNIGATRTVTAFDSVTGDVTWAMPLRYAVVNDDRFEIHPGCNKTIDHCRNKFANFNLSGGLRYRGYAYVPKPETLI